MFDVQCSSLAWTSHIAHSTSHQPTIPPKGAHPLIFNLFLGLWITAGIIYSFVIPDAQNLKASQAAYFHVPMAVAMLICFMVSAVYGALWLFKRQEKFDALSLGFAEAGFAGSVIAFITGTIWGKINWGMYWTWDPQQVGVLATAITYAALFSLRGAVDDEAKTRNFWAVYAIFGALVALFGSYIFRHIGPQSLHPDDTVRSSDKTFKYALSYCIIGYIMLLCKIGIVRARLEVASNKLKALAWD